MNKIFKNKNIGFYFITLATILGIVATISYIVWAPAHHSMNNVIVAALVVGIVIGIVLHFYDNDFLVVAITACYAIAGFQLFSDGTGSFVDAYQGIVMFGDSSQVGTIITIGAMMLVCAIASIVAGFTNRIKY